LEVLARRSAPFQARIGGVGGGFSRQGRIIFPTPCIMEAFTGDYRKKIKSFFLIFFRF
jgi:hypothetical protein